MHTLIDHSLISLLTSNHDSSSALTNIKTAFDMYLYIGIDNLFTVKGKHRVSKKTNYKKHQDTGRRRFE